jgi:hypothetical protein
MIDKLEKDMDLRELCELYADRIRSGDYDKNAIVKIATNQWDSASELEENLLGRIRWLTNIRITGSDKIDPRWWQIAFQAEWDGPLGDKFESGSFFLINYIAAKIDSPDINTAIGHLEEISEAFSNEPWPLMLVRDEYAPHYVECLGMNETTSEDLKVWLAVR